MNAQQMAVAPADPAPPGGPALVAVTATERGDWSWSFAPTVRAEDARRLACLCAEIASARAILDEQRALHAGAWRRMDAETELCCVRQRVIAADALADAAAMGYRLVRVVPAVGREGW